jgi:TldD protein
MTRPFLFTRRDFAKSIGSGGALLAAHTLLPSQAIGRSQRAPALDPTIIIDGTDVHTLAIRALDAAKSAGATYADVRLTRSLSQGVSLTGRFEGENESVGFGVRALVDGVWGFAASPYWNLEEAAQLGRIAARQAFTIARGMPVNGRRIQEWKPIPAIVGNWSPSGVLDPFVIPPEEKMDFLDTWVALALRYRHVWASYYGATFTREERVVATSEGSYVTQTLYRSSGGYSINRSMRDKVSHASAKGLAETAAGWELFTETDIRAQLPRMYEEADPSKMKELQKVPGDIGRYNVVCDAKTMANLVNATIGTATQVDRALGYEANAGGTSYLGPDPLMLLGKYQAAAPLVTISANRSMLRGAATVRWDDEGVVPDDFTLVKNGVLVDYQTTREQAPWLGAWYAKQGKSIHSHGCASADSALSITMQHTPNLVLEPGEDDIGFEDLVKNTSKGLAILGGGVDADFQEKTGTIVGEIREIVNGKLGSVVTSLSVLFDTTQLWKNVSALGGAQSAIQVVLHDRKGNPGQTVSHSVRAVPAAIRNVSFIDRTRKA